MYQETVFRSRTRTDVNYRERIKGSGMGPAERQSARPVDELPARQDP